jgi:hypothetical protein
VNKTSPTAALRVDSRSAPSLRDVVEGHDMDPEALPASWSGVRPEGVQLLPTPRWGDYAPAIARHEAVLGRKAPAPTIDGRLSPVFVEWMMMLPEGWVTDLDISRTQMLKMLGNTNPPAQYAAGWGSLLGLVSTPACLPACLPAAHAPDLGRQRSGNPRQRGTGPADGADMALIPTPTAWLGRRPSQAVGDAERWANPARSRELSDFIAHLTKGHP